MERWSSLSTGQKAVAVTIGVSAGVAMLYVCYSRYRTAPRHGEDELRMTIPRDAAHLIITEPVMAQCHAHIQVTPDGGGDRELIIKGTPKQVRQSQRLLHGALQDGAALRAELHLPSRSIGRVMGHGGERIREIARSSGATIDCGRRTEGSQTAPTRRITITGTQEQVEAAKTLLLKASEEEAAVQRRATECSTFRSRRKEIIAVKKQRPPENEDRQPQTPAEDRPSKGDSPGQENMADTVHNVYKFEVPSPDFSFRADEYVDVYVSAVENPDHFWIQILGSRSSQLDKLTIEMSDHYQRQKRESVAEIQVGDIVAAPFHDDKLWYRAEVLGFLKNGNVDLYYVDYGDNWTTGREKLFPLRSDFLSLPFQAIECRLSGVAPRGGTWSDQALDVFDTLSYCAEWKPLLAKISSFPSPGVSCCFEIQLYDPASDPMLDVGLELIRRGHAVQRRSSPVKADEDESLVSRLLDEVTNLSLGSEAGTFSSRQEEGRLASDGSIEMIRADVNPSPDLQQSVASIPLSFPDLQQSVASISESCPESVEEVDILEQTISKIRISDGDLSLPTTSSPSTDPSTQDSSTSTVSSESSGEVPGSSSTCTASEGQSFVSSSLEDSSVYSPRGCFYYLTDEASSSFSGDVISISSDSEDDALRVQGGARKKAADSDVFLSSSSDVIVID